MLTGTNHICRKQYVLHRQRAGDRGVGERIVGDGTVGYVEAARAKRANERGIVEAYVTDQRVLRP